MVRVPDSIQVLIKSVWRAWFSPGTPVSFTSKTDRHDIAEILLNVALNTISMPISQSIKTEQNYYL
jgi:hypothetical protein